MQKLVSTFNTGVLTPKDTDTFENNEDIYEEECISTPASMTVTKAQSFYYSTEWDMMIDSTLNSYATIPLPSQPNHSNTITLQLQLLYMYLTLTALLVFSHPLSSHRNTMLTSLTGPSYMLSLSQQFLEEQEAMLVHLLPFVQQNVFT